jgi:hypothetical protein
MKGENNTWPKKWSEIEGKERPEYDDGYWKVGLELHAGVVRTYEGTLYINADSGHETDNNRDQWLPLGVYLEEGGKLQW